MSERHTGRVKWFNNKKGYGFINDCDTGEDIFVHFSAINISDNVYKSIIEGEYVEFDHGRDESNKLVAINLSGIRGGPLLCQNTERRVYSVRRDSRSGDRQERARRPVRRSDRRSDSEGVSHKEE